MELGEIVTRILKDARAREQVQVTCATGLSSYIKSERRSLQVLLNYFIQRLELPADHPDRDSNHISYLGNNRVGIVIGRPASETNWLGEFKRCADVTKECLPFVTSCSPLNITVKSYLPVKYTG